MKTYFVTIIAVIVMSFNLNAQVEINGVMLGSKIELVNEYITFIGENYWLISDNTKDGRCAMLGFTPINYTGERNVSSREFYNLKDSLEAKYGLELKFFPKNRFCKHKGDWKQVKDGVFYALSVHKYNRFRFSPYALYLNLYNIELYDSLLKEEQEIAN